MVKRLFINVLIVLAISHNLFCEIDVTKIFSSSQFNGVTSDIATNPSKLSPMTKKLLSEIQNNDSKSELIQNSKKAKEFLLKKINNEVLVGGLIRINDESAIEELQSCGVKIGTRAGNILSVQLPLNNLEKICNSSRINYLQIDEPVIKKLDKVRLDINSEKVNSGIDLPKSYKGSGVIVGVVDGGFDYTHLNFLREDASEYRILRVWDQSLEGTPPQGFSYGHELTTSNQMLNQLTDAIFASHGTHVAGIAAGSGYNSSGKYFGVAPDADLVFVSLGYVEEEKYSTGQSAILDGINYIFQTAQNLGKPAVVNLSLGTHIGPHDGNSLFDEACHALVGNGKIIVGSAGNEGEVPLHLGHKFTTTATEVHTFMEIEPVYGGEEPAIGILDIWCGKVPFDFNIVISLINLETEQRVSTEMYSTTQAFNNTITLTGSDNNDCEISLYLSNAEFNGMPRAFIYVETMSSDKVLISLQADNGSINMWNHGTGGGYPLTSYDITGITDGDVNCTVGEIGGTGKDIITVGSYTTKNQFTNLSGDDVSNGFTTGDISPFSSLGPTADERVKPDITAPGAYVISSVNSFDFLMQKGSYYDFMLAEETTIDGSYYWYYAGMEGTSMSSPVVVGVVALMLEVNPNLTPFLIKNNFERTSREDSYTGKIPNLGSNTWGFGKIDAFAAVNRTVTDVIENDVDNFDFFIYPNPASDYFFVSSKTDYGSVKIVITDILGNNVWIDDNYSMHEPIYTSQFSQNIYFVKLFNNTGVLTKRLIINK